MRNILRVALVATILLISAISSFSLTAAQWMAAATAPTFKPGVTLPRVMISGYPQTDAFWSEWYIRWHGAFQVECGRQDGADIATITTAQSYRLARVAQANGWPVAAKIYRPLSVEAYMWGLPDATWARNLEGERWPGYGTSTTSPPHVTRTPGCWSPAMPTSVSTQAGVDEAVSLAILNGYATITELLNDGEQGPDVPSARHPTSSDIQDFAKWSQDADCIALFGGAPTEATVSARRAVLLQAEATALRMAAPGASTYLYYRASSPDLRGVSAETWKGYLGRWDELRGVVTHGAPSLYYGSGPVFTGAYDLPSRATCVAGYQIGKGDLSYIPYVSGGWGATVRADYSGYLGYLKFLAMTGAVSFVAGDFDATVNTGVDFLTCPDWLKYRQIASHAQGWLSWVYTDFWVNGDLLAGPNMHAWAHDQAAYEYPTSDPAVRCAIRKLRASNIYLVMAWNSSGVDRYASVTMPLGTYNLYARACGTTYRITSTGVVFLDANYTNPSASMATVPPVPPPSTNHAPVAADQRYVTVRNVAKDLLLRASDADGDALTYSIVTGPAHGVLTGLPGRSSIVYTPATGWTGTDSFTYRANDGAANSNTATVRVSVTAH